MKKFLVTAALAAAFLSTGASATNLVTNGSFESTTLNYKGQFQGNVTGWSGGAGFVSLDTPGTATTTGTGPGNNYAVYGPFASTSPDGGNFVQMDGDSNYAAVIYQQISGLTIGQGYTLSYYQAAGQQVGFCCSTTERWAVNFASTLQGGNTMLSPLYSLAGGGVGPWQLVTARVTATAASEYLSFLAVGTPNGVPPTSFLDGVSLAVPEPATWGMMIVGLGAMGIAARRRRRTLAAA